MMAEGLDDDIRQVMARNEEILERRRQQNSSTRTSDDRERLAVLEAEQRREYLLACMEYDPLGTWRNLTQDEKNEKSFVVKALKCTPHIFGTDPWDEQYLGTFPAQFLNDRDALLACLSRSDYERRFNSKVIDVPESLRDDKEVMIVLCSKKPEALEFASPRLQDDEDVVFAAIRARSYYAGMQFQHASPRIRGDKDFVLREIEHAANDCFFCISWLRFHELSHETARELMFALLERDLGHMAEKVLDHVQSLRDDKDVMFRLVQRKWHALRLCSDNLKACEQVVEAAMAQSDHALKYALGKYKVDKFSLKDKDTVLSVLNGREEWPQDDLNFKDDISSELQSDPDVLLDAVLNGHVKFEDLPNHLRENKKFILEIVKADQENISIYDFLPEPLQHDEEFCIEMLKLGYAYDEGTIFENVPTLYDSKEAVLAVTKLAPADYDTFPKIIRESSFRDDADVMLAACKNELDCLVEASERLLSDHEFVFSLTSNNPYSISRMSEDVQLSNIDAVVMAIEKREDSDMLNRLAEGVFDHRSVVMACLKRGWPVFRHVNRVSNLRDDPELLRIAVNVSPSEFQHASPRLKADHEFVRSLAVVNGRSLRFAEGRFRRDDKILTMAVANTAGSIVDCFGSGTNADFEYVVAFAARLRSRLELYESFVWSFLRGISVAKPHVAPPLRCCLHLLDRGVETGIALKKSIAEFLDVPLGAELHRLRAASVNLRKLGF